MEIYDCKYCNRRGSHFECHAGRKLNDTSDCANLLPVHVHVTSPPSLESVIEFLLPQILLNKYLFATERHLLYHDNNCLWHRDWQCLADSSKIISVHPSSKDSQRRNYSVLFQMHLMDNGRDLKDAQGFRQEWFYTRIWLMTANNNMYLVQTTCVPCSNSPCNQ